MRTVLAVLASLAFLTVAAVTARADTNASAPPAAVTPASPSCTTLQALNAQLDENHEKHVEFTATDALGITVADLGHLVLATLGDKFVLAIEIDGCMHGPVVLGQISPAA